MGKKNKHSKDKLYKTVGELQSHHVGANRDLELSVLHRRLKFDSCCLSLNSVSDKHVGLCDDDSFCYVFECDIIVKFLEKYQIHPVTGKKVTAKDLIELKFHKNNEGQYHCPIIYKLFNQHSKIVANKKSGTVYSFDAYQQLNLKPNNFKDLLTDEPFERDDIVTIQDPTKADEKWNVGSFYYVKNKLKWKNDDDDNGASNRIRDIEGSSILKASLEEYKRKADSIVENFNKLVGQDDQSSSKQQQVILDKINSAHQSDGTLARSVTSTVMPIASVQNAAILDYEQILYPRIKKKGYIQLVTTHGPINLELFCDKCPKTCHNFLLLATRGYYDNTCFHRVIKNFILQGGDPSQTGSGGESAWGGPFKDECYVDLKQIGRGALAMANSGPNTNKSQFYITFRGGDELDNQPRSTVFGRVVGGDQTLNRIEAVEVDKQDRPLKEVKILKVNKFVDPFEETEAAIEEERKKERVETGKRSSDSKATTQQSLKKFRSGIGAYINLEALQKEKSSNDDGFNQTIDCDSESKSGDSTALATKLANLGNNKRVTDRRVGDFLSW